jgi:hypothetical protein
MSMVHENYLSASHGRIGKTNFESFGHGMAHHQGKETISHTLHTGGVANDGVL